MLSNIFLSHSFLFSPKITHSILFLSPRSLSFFPIWIGKLVSSDKRWVFHDFRGCHYSSAMRTVRFSLISCKFSLHPFQNCSFPIPQDLVAWHQIFPFGFIISCFCQELWNCASRKSSTQVFTTHHSPLKFLGFWQSKTSSFSLQLFF